MILFVKKHKVELGILAVILISSFFIYGIRPFIGILILSGYLLIPIGLGIGIIQLWKLAFCRGYSTADGVKFEVSTFSEYILYVLNILVAILVSWMLFSGAVDWYDWIFALLLILTSVGGCFSIYSNKNDYIIVSKGKILYRNDDLEEEFNFAKYSFSKGESKALVLTFSRESQWHLELESEQVTKISFDLTDMNLGFHKKAIERCLNSLASSY